MIFVKGLDLWGYADDINLTFDKNKHKEQHIGGHNCPIYDMDFRIC